MSKFVIMLAHTARRAPLAWMLVLVLLWPCPGRAADARVIQDINYVGTSPPVTGDLYLPADAPNHAPHAAVVVIHGGAWRFGSKDDPKVRAMADFLLERGYAVFAINYPLGSPGNPVVWPLNLLDCKAAVQWLRVNAQAYGIAPDRIGAIGFSAGGQLATMLAMTATNPELQPRQHYAGVLTGVAAVIDFYGPVVIRGWETRTFEARPATQGNAPQGSPMSYVRSGLPPIMVVYGSQDNRMHLADASYFMSALERAGVPHKLVVVEGARHGFNPLSPETDVSADMLAFLNDHLPAGSPRSTSHTAAH